MNWSGYDWFSEQIWGNIDPNKTIQWYDPSAIVLSEDGSLNLKTHYNPKYFDHLNVTSPIGIGLMTSEIDFEYGTFEIEAKLPPGKQLWPAFWMYPISGDYREIDIFEGYSNSLGNYWHFDIKTPFAIWRIKSNLHYQNAGEPWNDLGSNTKFFTWKNPAKNFNRYTLHWSENEITIWYNDKLIRVADKSFVDLCKNRKMRVLLNNAIRNKADLTPSHKESNFIVKKFKYTPL
jgi:beta-glucanase (GH16 family)